MIPFNVSIKLVWYRVLTKILKEGLCYFLHDDASRCDTGCRLLNKLLEYSIGGLVLICQIYINRIIFTSNLRVISKICLEDQLQCSPILICVICVDGCPALVYINYYC